MAGKKAAVAAQVAATTLHDKLLEVAREVRAVARKKTNESQGYKFAGAFDVQQEVLPKLLDRGVLFYPERRSIHSVQHYLTKSGTSQFLVLHQTQWVATDGINRVEVSVIGSGTDMGDKGAYKGMTGDMKYALTQLLGIAFVDMDPEVDEAEEREPTPLENLVSLAKQANMGKAELAAFVEKETGKTSSKELTDSEIETLTTMVRVMISAGGGTIVT